MLCLAALAFFLFFPTQAEEYTAGLRPNVFYAALDPEMIAADLEGEYGQVIGVAHNSGDSITTTLEALAYGADAIEIDVVSVDGELYSSHAPPLPLIGSRVFRGPSLGAIWTAAAQTDLVSLDLKESSPDYLELVLDFLTVRRREHQIVITTADVESHRFFAERMPEVLRFYSVGNQQALTTLQENPDLVALLDGVSIQNDLVDEETARWLNERELRMLVWTVNDLERANELIRLGAAALTTDNLALLSLFGGQQRGEDSLEQIDATPVPGAELRTPAGRRGDGKLASGAGEDWR